MHRPDRQGFGKSAGIPSFPPAAQTPASRRRDQSTGAPRLSEGSSPPPIAPPINPFQIPSVPNMSAFYTPESIESDTLVTYVNDNHPSSAKVPASPAIIEAEIDQLAQDILKRVVHGRHPYASPAQRIVSECQQKGIPVISVVKAVLFAIRTVLDRLSDQIQQSPAIAANELAIIFEDIAIQFGINDRKDLIPVARIASDWMKEMEATRYKTWEKFHELNLIYEIDTAIDTISAITPLNPSKFPAIKQETGRFFASQASASQIAALQLPQASAAVEHEAHEIGQPPVNGLPVTTEYDISGDVPPPQFGQLAANYNLNYIKNAAVACFERFLFENGLVCTHKIRDQFQDWLANQLGQEGTPDYTRNVRTFHNSYTRIEGRVPNIKTYLKIGAIVQKFVLETRATFVKNTPNPKEKKPIPSVNIAAPEKAPLPPAIKPVPKKIQAPENDEPENPNVPENPISYSTHLLKLMKRVAEVSGEIADIADQSSGRAGMLRRVRRRIVQYYAQINRIERAKLRHEEIRASIETSVQPANVVRNTAPNEFKEQARTEQHSRLTRFFSKVIKKTVSDAAVAKHKTKEISSELNDLIDRTCELPNKATRSRWCSQGYSLDQSYNLNILMRQKPYKNWRGFQDNPHLQKAALVAFFDRCKNPEFVQAHLGAEAYYKVVLGDSYFDSCMDFILFSHANKEVLTPSNLANLFLLNESDPEIINEMVEVARFLRGKIKFDDLVRLEYAMYGEIDLVLESEGIEIPPRALDILMAPNTQITRELRTQIQAIRQKELGADIAELEVATLLALQNNPRLKQNWAERSAIIEAFFVESGFPLLPELKTQLLRPSFRAMFDQHQAETNNDRSSLPTVLAVIAVHSYDGYEGVSEGGYDALNNLFSHHTILFKDQKINHLQNDTDYAAGIRSDIAQRLFPELQRVAEWENMQGLTVETLIDYDDGLFEMAKKFLFVIRGQDDANIVGQMEKFRKSVGAINVRMRGVYQAKLEEIDHLRDEILNDPLYRALLRYRKVIPDHGQHWEPGKGRGEIVDWNQFFPVV